MQQLPVPNFQRQLTPTVDRQEIANKRETILSLPECVTLRSKWLGTVNVNGKPTPYLPSGLTALSQSESSLVENQLKDLRTLVSGYGDVFEDEQKQTMLTKMFLAKPSGPMTEIGAASRAESYMQALDDIPAWAVEDAIKRWHRGGISGVSADDFKWAPDSAVLRKLAIDALMPYRENIWEIERILAAKSLDEVLKNAAV